MAPQVQLEDSKENLEKLLEALNNAIEHSERDFHTLEQKPDQDEALQELEERVTFIKDEVQVKLVIQVPKAAGDVATELGQLETVSRGAVELMENLEKSLESADLDLVNAIAHSETQLEEANSAFTQVQQAVAERLTPSVVGAMEAHEKADGGFQQFKNICEELHDDTQKLF